ncbi:hypothetical protein [Nonomuraea polychroma]|uniref:hypothetical protein n=1 Tax=Nonomuraea polychroma TaxID=46176 RepID=UPI0013E2DA51|nr:hypothetical protein [Nonomuraea polychroma]
MLRLGHLHGRAVPDSSQATAGHATSAIAWPKEEGPLSSPRSVRTKNTAVCQAVVAVKAAAVRPIRRARTTSIAETSSATA